MRELMLIFHFLGLVMGLGTGFAHAFLGAAVNKMSVDETRKFRLDTLVLSRMGHIGIALLIISGFYLITPFWKIVPSSPLLILKLVLVAILVVLLILISLSAKKAKTGDAERQLKKMEALGKMTLITGVVIVIVAVNVFR